MMTTRFNGWMAMVLGASMVLPACGGRGNPGVEPDSSGGTDNGSVVTPASEFVLSHTFAATSYLHDVTPTDWSKSCTVPVTASTSATKYINCMLEAHELDLYSNELTIAVKAPLAQCPFLAVYPYWFWIRKAGMGPTAVTINEDQSATPATYSLGTVTRAAGGASDVGVTNVGATLVCNTDYSAINGPNCCSGGYIKTYNLTPAGGGAPTTTMTYEFWNGKIGNCAAGPGAASDWGRTVADNMPVGKLIPATIENQTASFSIDLKKPIETLDKTSLYRANYHPLTPPIPASLNAGAYYTATTTAQYKPQPSYLFLCLDYASEIRARIALQIRKWNTVAELAKQSAGDWNDVGPENTDPGFPSEPKNDYIGWEHLDDAGSGYTSPYYLQGEY